MMTCNWLRTQRIVVGEWSLFIDCDRRISQFQDVRLGEIGHISSLVCDFKWKSILFEEFIGVSCSHQAEMYHW